MPLFDNSGRDALSRSTCTREDGGALAAYVMADLRGPSLGGCEPFDDEDEEDDVDDGREQQQQQQQKPQQKQPSMPGPAAFATQHRSMYAWDGYGMGADSIDCDGRLRLAAEATTSRERACLSTRVFVAAPNLSRGWMQDAVACPPPPMLTSVDTSDTRRCFRLAESDYDRFNPGVCAVGVEHVVPPWTAGGASSRDIARSAPFQQAFARLNRRLAKQEACPAAASSASCPPLPQPDGGGGAGELGGRGAPVGDLASCVDDGSSKQSKKAARAAAAQAEAARCAAETADACLGGKAWRSLLELGKGPKVRSCTA